MNKRKYWSYLERFYTDEFLQTQAHDGVGALAGEDGGGAGFERSADSLSATLLEGQQAQLPQPLLERWLLEETAAKQVEDLMEISPDA